MNDNRVFLGIYAVIILVLVGGQITIGVTAYHSESFSESSISKELDTAWAKANSNDKETIQNKVVPGVRAILSFLLPFSYSYLACF